MPAAEAATSFSLPGAPKWSEAHLFALFQPFLAHQRIVLAVSGGPDSTALMLLAARWRALLPDGPGCGPDLRVASVDHGLRPQARSEAEAVGRLAAWLALPHAILTLDEPLSSRSVQETARRARYAVMTRHAQSIGATAIVTAHTLDDQAETVLFRLMRGSGLTGLAGMPPERLLGGVALLRPLLGLRKQVLIDVCRRADVAFVEDPSNSDVRFTRARLRQLLPQLAMEGLTAEGLVRLAQRLARAEAALEVAVDAAEREIVVEIAGAGVGFSRDGFRAAPEEIGLRLLTRAIRQMGTEGTPELGKLETLHAWLRADAPGTHAATRTLAGALVRLRSESIEVRPAPARRTRSGPPDANLHSSKAIDWPAHLGKYQGRT